MKEILAVLVLAALVFGGCFLVDKGFTRLFRNQSQHRSGTAVRSNKRYGAIGILVGVLVVCLVLWLSDLISNKVTKGRLHPSAIAIFFIPLDFQNFHICRAERKIIYFFHFHPTDVVMLQFLRHTFRNTGIE